MRFIACHHGLGASAIDALHCMPAGVRAMGSRRIVTGSSCAQPHTPSLLSSSQALQRLCRNNSASRLTGALLGQRATHIAAAGSSSGTGSAAAGSPSSASSSDRPRVCILGGGFGGLYTAIKLELLMWPKGKKPQITLVDQNDRFIFKPLLYELLNGTAQAGEVAPTFNQLLAPYHIQFVQDKVVEVQPEQVLQDGGSASGGQVLLASGARLDYDWLVVALGAAADPRGVPGVRQCARPFVSLEDAEFVAGRLAALEARAATGQPTATVVVVGAGYAGVELASVVAERVAGNVRVLLVTPGPDILDAAPAGQREAARQALQGLGVTILTNSKVAGVEEVPAASSSSSSAEGSLDAEFVAVSSATSSAVVAAAAMELSSSSSSSDPSYIVRLEPAAGSSSSSSDIFADLVLWTAGSRAASQPLKPFPVDTRGQLQTDATLRVLKHARAFALGDVSKGQPESSSGSSSVQYYPATAQVAFQQADYAAWNIWAAINGRPLLPFRYQHLGDMMSLGAANAAVALPVQLPAELSATISSSPLGSLLAVAGVKLDQQEQGVTLEGPLAQLLRRAAYLYRQPTQEQRLQVAASWISQAADAAARLAAEASSSSSSSR